MKGFFDGSPFDNDPFFKDTGFGRIDKVFKEANQMMK